MTPPLHMRRPPLMQPDELERIEQAALGILQEHGIRVLEDDLRAELSGKGFAEGGGRVRLEEAVVREFLEEERRRNGNRFAEGPADPDVDADLTVSVSPYPQHVHDLDSDTLVPYTTERLIEATKLVDALAERGLVSIPPGCPCDVAPALQPVLQYWIGATYSRQGKRPVDAKSEAGMAHVMAMADVLGHPLEWLPVYLFSPLTLSGESLRCVLRFRERLRGIGVSSMPSVGLTAPVAVGDAFALAAAEVIGSAILVRELVDLPVRWSVNLFPVDLRTMAMVFGSPESHLLELAGNEVDAFLKGTRWHPSASNIHTNAKLPGAQACAEKSSTMTAGALLGARHFGSVGTLSLDEVFSPEQLVYDMEMTDHVRRLVAGVVGKCDPESCVEQVSEALEAGSFAGLDETLDGYRDFYWHPELFERSFLPAWQAKGAPDPRRRAKAIVAELVTRHDYRLPVEQQRGIDDVLNRARHELGDGRTYPFPRR